MKTLVALTAMFLSVQACHAEAGSPVPVRECLRRKAAAAFKVEFGEDKPKENVAKLQTLFRLGASEPQIRKQLTEIAGSRKDVRLLDGLSVNPDGSTTMTFYVMCDGPSEETISILDFSFLFRDGKLSGIEYSTATMPREDA